MPPPLHPRGEHLHRARLELGDLRLWIERVVCEEICGGFGEVPGDECHAHCRLLSDRGAQEGEKGMSSILDIAGLHQFDI